MLIHADGAIVHATPNATMTTFASPRLGARDLAVWQVRMEPGQAGPEHVIHGEQVWVVLDGRMHVDLAGGRLTGRAGDTLVLPADERRRISAPDGLVAMVAARAGVLVSAADRPTAPLPWAE